MKLVKTYNEEAVHTGWVDAYRRDAAQDAFNDRIMDRILDVVKPEPDALVLDAGCGTGNHTTRILKRGYRCVAVDISQHVQSRAAEQLDAMGLGGKAMMTTHALEELGFGDNMSCCETGWPPCHPRSQSSISRDGARAYGAGGSL